MENALQFLPRCNEDGYTLSVIMGNETWAAKGELEGMQHMFKIPAAIVTL